LRAPSAVGAPINAARLRRWALDFSSYRHQISERAVSDWIDQFKDDRDVAARLLDVVDFYTIDRISGCFRTVLASLPGWHVDPNRRAGKWRFAAMAGSAGESGDAMMHRFRVANRLDGAKYSELFIYRSEILLADLGADDTLVLIDDFIGTGESVCLAWKRAFEELVPGIGKVYLLVVAALEQGKQKVETDTSATCVAANDLVQSDNFFAKENTHFSDADKEIVLKHCRKAHKNQPQGFGDCGLVLAFQHRCPNNSLPVLHADNGRWCSLFPRHG